MDTLKNLRRINDLCLFVKDFDGAVDFFQKKFEFELKRLQPDAENANYAEFEFNGTSLTLWQRDGLTEIVDEKYLAGKGHNFMVAIKVGSVDEVNRIHERLISNGVYCVKAPEDYVFGSRAAYYHDFEENIWEVFAWIEGGDGPGVL